MASFVQTCPELLEHLRNYQWLRRTYTEPLNAIRSVNGFVQNIRNYRKFTTRCTELLEGFVVKLRNPLEFWKLKKVLYENGETIFMPRNL